MAYGSITFIICILVQTVHLNIEQLLLYGKCMRHVNNLHLTRHTHTHTRHTHTHTQNYG